MSPKIDLPTYFANPEADCQEMADFLNTLKIKKQNFELIIPEISKNIYRITVDFKRKKEWELFCFRYWGKEYFNRYIKRIRNRC